MNNADLIVRLKKAEHDRDRAVGALIGMCVQYLTDSPKDDDDSYRRFEHMFMSAGEGACAVLCDLGFATENATGATLTREAFDDWFRG